MRTGQAIEEFIDSRVANNLSPLTIEWYILERGITEQELERYPLWDGPLRMTPPNGRRT